MTVKSDPPSSEGIPVDGKNDQCLTYPMSFAQQRLWFVQRAEDNGAAYNVPLFIRLDGPLDVAALQTAVGDVVERHEVLRTLLVETGGRPHQRIVSAGEGRRRVRSPIVDVESTRLSEALDDLACEPFDLAVDLPFRAHLVRVGASEHVLAMVLHHVAFDGWSVEPLFCDLGIAYSARQAGRLPEWKPLPVQYADYALWQRRLLGEHQPSALAQRQLEYWREALAGVPDQLALPFDRPRPPVAAHRGAVLETDLSGHHHDCALALAREHGCTLFTVLHAAVAVLLTRSGAGVDLPLGVPIAGRTDDALTGLIGFFVNTLVLRADTSGDPSFAELLDRTRTTHLDAFENQDLPFERLVEDLNPARSTARHPLFQVLVALNDVGPDDALHLPGVQATTLRQTTDTAKFDLSFDFENRFDHRGRALGLRLSLEYATHLFNRTTISALAERLVRVLDAVLAHPTLRVHEVPILTAPERRRLLTLGRGPAWSERHLDPVEAVRRRALQTPDAVAVSGVGMSLTFRELTERIDGVAAALVAAGAGPDDLVAVHAERSVWFVAAAFGVLGAGAAYMAIDRTLPPGRIRTMLADSGTRFLVAGPGTPPVHVDGVHRVSPALDGNPPTSSATPDSLAYAVFTSGSTGRPKGVLVPHRGLSNHLLAVIELYGLTEQDTIAFNAPLTFDVAVWQALTLPVSGGRVHVIDDETVRDPMALARCVFEDHITVLQIVPQVLLALLELCDLDGSCARLLSGLRWMLVHGDELPPDLVDRWFAWHPHVPLANVYGPAECSDDVSISIITAGDIVRRHRAPIGRPLRNTSVYVLDDHRQLVPVGQPGELYVGGAGLARGYAGQPKATAERFVPNPFGAAGERIYRTGDLVRWNEGDELEFLGRIDHQVKIRGFRVEPGEVAAVLCQAPDVRHAFVQAGEGPSGDGGLVAYLVPARGAGPDLAAVRRRVATAVPEHMVPASFVVLDELPLTVNGKIDRAALPRPRAEPVAARPPTGPDEAALRDLFAEVLGAADIGVCDSFFDHGGHSMLAMRLMSRARVELGLEIGVRTLFDTPTVVGILADAQRLDTSHDVLLPLRDGIDPLFCVHAATGLAWSYAGLSAHLPSRTALYGLQAPGLVAGEPLPPNVETMLDRMLDAIRRVQPAGPFRLLGWSLGGTIAHALAGRLQADGDEVEQLALIDAFPGPTWNYPPTARREQADELALLAALAPAGTTDPRSPDADLEPMRRAALKHSGLEPAMFERLVRVGIHAAGLLSEHRPAPVSGSVLHFTATRSHGPARPRADAWLPYVDHLVPYELDCHHEEAMNEGPRALIADILTTTLHETSAND